MTLDADLVLPHTLPLLQIISCLASYAAKENTFMFLKETKIHEAERDSSAWVF